MKRTLLFLITLTLAPQTYTQETIDKIGGLSMKETIFREYDIRGIVDKELYIDQVYDLGRAIAYYLKQHNPDFNVIAIGMDGRTHSPQIKDELRRAFLDSGIDVAFLGVCPTPALYFSLFTLDVDGGLIVTASHNGPEFNGIKLCLGTTVVWGKELQVIKKMYQEKKHIEATRSGTHTEFPIVTPYVAWLVDHFWHLKNIKLSFVIDCGNGTAGTVLPKLIQKMQWDNVKLLYEKVDGTFPHHEADPTVAKNMADVKRALSTEDFSLGLGLDGDCDRMAAMTKAGTLITGDQLLAVFAEKLLTQHPGAGVVFDIKSSSGLVELLKRWGGQPIMSPSGHSIIKDMMHKHNALLGGELSGHFFFKDRYFGYDDGIYATLRLIEILFASGKSLEKLLAIFPKKCSSQEFRLYCPDEKKQDIVEHIKQELEKRSDVSLITIDGVRATFPFGWGIVRASNTQAALSMRFESDTQKGLEQVIDIFYELLKPYIDAKELQALHTPKG